MPLAVDASDYTIYAVLDKTQVDNNNNKLYVDEADFPKVTEFLNKELGIDKELIEQQLNSEKLKSNLVRQEQRFLSLKWKR